MSKKTTRVPKKTLGVRLDAATLAEIEEGAGELGITSSEYARRMIAHALVFMPQIEDGVRALGNDFGLQRRQVVQNILLDFFARQQARVLSGKKEPPELPMFVSGPGGLLTGDDLLYVLLARYVQEEKESTPDRLVAEANERLGAVLTFLKTIKSGLEVVVKLHKGQITPEIRELVAIIKQMEANAALARSCGVASQEMSDKQPAPRAAKTLKPPDLPRR